MTAESSESSTPTLEEEESPSPPQNGGGKEEASDSSGAGEATEESEALSPFLAEVRAPISNELPAGEDILYDEDFRALKTQIDVIGSASGEADYERIAELSRTILTEKSKDLRAAGYLVLGEARCRGAKGFAEGMGALHLLIEEYWESLYPELTRMRGRGSALQFVGDRLPDWLGAASFGPSDREPLGTALEYLEEIQSFGLQEMGEHAPSLSGLKNELNDALSDLPKPKEASDTPSSSESSKSESGADSSESESSSSQSSSATTSPSEIVSESDAEQAIGAAVRFFRDQDLTHPLSYQLLRTIRWGQLSSTPPHESGTSRFEPPREQRREYLEGLLEEDEYELLVREGESSLHGGTFHVWLDLQRLVGSALDALGRPYEDACEAVKTQTALLVRRIPSLPSLSFKDGTPFASPLTVEWIETQVEPLLSMDNEEESRAEQRDEGAEVADQYRRARNELTGGNLDAALSIMEEGKSMDSSKKEEFHRQLYVATLCIKAERPQIARPLLDQLKTAVVQHGIGTWEPTLAIEVWTRRYQCYEQLAQGASNEEAEAYGAAAKAMFEKICQAEPTEAISLLP